MTVAFLFEGKRRFTTETQREEDSKQTTTFLLSFTFRILLSVFLCVSPVSMVNRSPYTLMLYFLHHNRR
jgi:hypothetical protein